MTKTILPCSNHAILKDKKCQMPSCTEPASVDAQLYGHSQWAYMCLAHLERHGTTNSAYITNITEEPITLDWLTH